MPRNGTNSGEEFLNTWEPRIGREAALTLKRQVRAKRTFGLYGLIWLVSEIAFQLPTNTLGIRISMVWFVVAIGYFVHSIRLISLAAEQAGLYLGMPKGDRKYVPLRWVSTFDRWIDARDSPGWPRKALRRL